MLINTYARARAALASEATDAETAAAMAAAYGAADPGNPVMPVFAAFHADAVAIGKKRMRARVRSSASDASSGSDIGDGSGSTTTTTGTAAHNVRTKRNRGGAAGRRAGILDRDDDDGSDSGAGDAGVTEAEAERDFAAEKESERLYYEPAMALCDTNHKKWEVLVAVSKAILNGAEASAAARSDIGARVAASIRTTVATAPNHKPKFSLSLPMDQVMYHRLFGYAGVDVFDAAAFKRKRQVRRLTLDWYNSYGNNLRLQQHGAPPTVHSMFCQLFLVPHATLMFCIDRHTKLFGLGDPPRMLTYRHVRIESVEAVHDGNGTCTLRFRLEQCDDWHLQEAWLPPLEDNERDAFDLLVDHGVLR